MEPLRSALAERVAEVDAYLEFLTAVEVAAGEGNAKVGDSAVSPTQQKMLYSAVYLHLYNLVEATVVNCLEHLKDAYSTRTPHELSAELRREWVRARAKTDLPLGDEKRTAEVVDLLDHAIAGKPVGSWRVATGMNWDDKEIDDLTRKVGLRLKLSASVMRSVKEPKYRNGKGALVALRLIRNDLAHGLLSFVECAGDLVVRELKEMRDRIVGYLEELVACFEAAIATEQFLDVSARTS